MKQKKRRYDQVENLPKKLSFTGDLVFHALSYLRIFCAKPSFLETAKVFKLYFSYCSKNKKIGPGRAYAKTAVFYRWLSIPCFILQPRIDVVELKRVSTLVIWHGKIIMSFNLQRPYLIPAAYARLKAAARTFSGTIVLRKWQIMSKRFTFMVAFMLWIRF